MDPFDKLCLTMEQIQNAVFSNTLSALIDVLYNECQSKPKSKELADQIRQIEWSDYRREMIELILKYMIDCEHSPDTTNQIKAIFVEYDPDNKWRIDVFFCPDYYGLDKHNDDWACKYVAYFSAPRIPVLPKTRLRLLESRDNPPFRYAVAELTRQMQLINDQIHKKNRSLPNIYLAFHDQFPITRLVKD